MNYCSASLIWEPNRFFLVSLLFQAYILVFLRMTRKKSKWRTSYCEWEACEESVKVVLAIPVEAEMLSFEYIYSFPLRSQFSLMVNFLNVFLVWNVFKLKFSMQNYHPFEPELPTVNLIQASNHRFLILVSNLIYENICQAHIFLQGEL